MCVPPHTDTQFRRGRRKRGKKKEEEGKGEEETEAAYWEAEKQTTEPVHLRGLPAHLDALSCVSTDRTASRCPPGDGSFT